MTKIALRFNRALRVFEILAGVARRDLAWYFGGKKYYSEHFDDLVRTKKWVFLVGCNNSGTTILHDLLVGTGLFTAMPNEGQRYTRQLVMAERRRFERVWTEYVDDLQMTEAHSTASAPRLAHDWLYNASPKDRSMVIEKTTANAVRTRWLQKAIPNSYFIGIIRNGYAVAEGIHRKGHKDLSRAARHWRKVNEFLKADSTALRHYLELRYEDIVQDPACILKKIANFLGESPDKFISEMNADRLENMNSYSLDRLTASDKEQIWAEAGPLLDEFRYDR